MRRPTNTTPYLLKAKWAGKCSDSRCSREIKPGDEALYYPASRKIVCRDCATPTLEALADEQMSEGY
jgi:hypothetical protein